ncbi:hypothetical protein JSY36_12940 [Bacillus sp. H-16]|uniref:hypothetical protein n=1 Tax=Alteribacter salitolerans TaxID=2912333 RepID=UPI001964A9FB|nr:hypothetical protein [Alteribacter salitolerans]MBM7096654.1 hypothetical protein [Alteribacter salitolerans]
MFKRNQIIRKEKGNIPNWIIAEKLNVHESTLLRWMRHEMPSTLKGEILDVIEQVKKDNLSSCGNDQKKITRWNENERTK